MSDAPLESVSALALRMAAIKAIKDVINATETETKDKLLEQMDEGDRKMCKTGDGHTVGMVIRTQPSSSLKVTDETAFLRWVKVNRPSAIVESVRDSDKKSILEQATTTGELPDGVDFSERASYIQVRQTYDQRERLLTYPSGEILDFAMTFDAPALEGGGE